YSGLRMALQIMLQGGEVSDLREYAREQKWSAQSEAQLYRYWQKAMELCQERSVKDREKLFARHILTRRLIQARAAEAGDLRTWLAAAKDDAELQNLYSAELDRPSRSLVVAISAGPR